MKCSILMASSLFLRSHKALSNCRSYLTSADVTTALRPFYFLVHPDLFGRFPKEQSVNEHSMKQLKSFLDTILSEGKTPKPVRVKFYLRPSESVYHRDSLKYINLDLKGGDIRKSVVKVLKGANLQTSYVDKIPDKDGRSKIFEADEEDFFEKGNGYKGEFMHTKLSKMDIRHGLDKWLQENVATARKMAEDSTPMALSARRIQDEICLDFGVKEIKWATDWLKHCRVSKLQGLRSLLENYSDVRHFLFKREVVFTEGHSGVCLDGQVCLFAGEVLENWLWQIQKLPYAESLLSIIPKVEKSLSQALRDIRLVRRKNMPITLANDYRSNLRQLLTTVNDFRSEQNFPASWPDSLAEFEMSIEDGNAPLTVTPAGQIVVPCNTPSFLLFPFLTEHLEEARAAMEYTRKADHEEAELIEKCVADLGLVGLRKGKGLSNEHMIDCCVRLLQYGPRIRHLTHGTQVIVTSYYGISEDGELSIPYFWVEEEGQTSHYF